MRPLIRVVLFIAFMAAYIFIIATFEWYSEWFSLFYFVALILGLFWFLPDKPKELPKENLLDQE